MVREHLRDILGVVLRGEAEQDALLLQRNELVLHRPERRSRVLVGVEADAVGPVLADDPAPKRPVAVEDEGLAQVGAAGAGRADDAPRELVAGPRRVRRAEPESKAIVDGTI